SPREKAMALIDYPSPQSLPEALRQELLNRRNSNVFRMLMNSPKIAPGFLAFSDGIRYGSSLSLDILELAILRVGHLCDARYEVAHHERHARNAGLSEAAIQAAGTGDLSGDLRDIERSVIGWVDDILKNDGLSREGL